MSGSRALGLGDWIRLLLFLAGLIGFGLLFNAGLRSRGVWPYNPLPTEVPLVRVIDRGRLTRPVPDFHIEEPAAALVVFIEATSDPRNAIESLDEEVSPLIEPGDIWVYYFDTLSDGTIWAILRCAVEDMDVPIADRLCQSSLFTSGNPPIEYLYEAGFVSANEPTY